MSPDYTFPNTADIVQSLPPVRGRISLEVNLDKVTWFRVGGPAQILFKPADKDDLIFFLKNKPKDLPIFPLGVGSNVIIRDGGIPGVVVRLGRPFNYIHQDPNKPYQLEVGASTLDRNLAYYAAENSLGGFGFLSGIPGTIGGALKMNAGAYGSEVKDILQSVNIIDEDGNEYNLTRDELDISYRSIKIPNMDKNYIFLSAAFEGYSEDKAAIYDEIEKIDTARHATQPVNERTGGSTFKNPDGLSQKEHKAWELIEKSGCRGLTVGGAKVSEKHCNFLINNGNATASDIENLGEKVRQTVKETTGVDLEWEILRLGVAA